MEGAPGGVFKAEEVPALEGSAAAADAASAAEGVAGGLSMDEAEEEQAQAIEGSAAGADAASAADGAAGGMVEAEEETLEGSAVGADAASEAAGAPGGVFEAEEQGLQGSAEAADAASAADGAVGGVSLDEAAEEAEAAAAEGVTPSLRGSAKGADAASAADASGAAGGISTEEEEPQGGILFLVPSFLRRPFPFVFGPPTITVVRASAEPMGEEAQAQTEGSLVGGSYGTEADATDAAADSGDGSADFFPSFLRPSPIPFPALVRDWFFGAGPSDMPTDMGGNGEQHSASTLYVSDGQGRGKLVVVEDGEVVRQEEWGSTEPITQPQRLEAAKQQQQAVQQQAQAQERKQHAFLLLVGAAVGAAFVLLATFGTAMFGGGAGVGLVRAFSVYVGEWKG